MSGGIVFDIRKFSVHDGPGIRTAVFLKGCPLSCPWCHNPEGRDSRPAILKRPDRCVLCHACDKACPLGLDPRRQAGSAVCAACPDFGTCARACPAEALQEVGHRYSVETVMAEIRKDRPFYDESGGGVTFTGGEPLAQAAFLLEILDACRSEGIHTAIETSGYSTAAIVKEIAARADLLIFDVKYGEAERGRKAVGVDYGVCLDNLAVAAEAAARAASGAGPRSASIVVRMPFIPGWNDSSAELADIAKIVRSAGTGIAGMELLPYHDSARGKYRLWNIDYPLAALEVPGDTAVEAALSTLSAAGVSARRGG